jgi:hypothetical protein
LDKSIIITIGRQTITTDTTTLSGYLVFVPKRDIGQVLVYLRFDLMIEHSLSAQVASLLRPL